MCATKPVKMPSRVNTVLMGFQVPVMKLRPHLYEPQYQANILIYDQARHFKHISQPVKADISCSFLGTGAYLAINKKRITHPQYVSCTRFCL